MASPDRAMRRGAFLGGVMVFGAGLTLEVLHWFMTPSVSGAASSGHRLLVALEGIVGVLLVIWAVWRMRRDSESIRADDARARQLVDEMTQPPA